MPVGATRRQKSSQESVTRGREEQADRKRRKMPHRTNLIVKWNSVTGKGSDMVTREHCHWQRVRDIVKGGGDSWSLARSCNKRTGSLAKGERCGNKGTRSLAKGERYCKGRRRLLVKDRVTNMAKWIWVTGMIKGEKWSWATGSLAKGH